MNMDTDTLSGQALDDLMAQFMGWRDGHFGYWAWGEHSEGIYMDFSGPSIARWHPSRGNSLSAAASDVLLKALAEGYTVVFSQQPGGFGVYVAKAFETEDVTVAPTLPLALCLAIREVMLAKEVPHA